MTEISKRSAKDNTFEIGSSITLLDLEDPDNDHEMKCAPGRWTFHTKPKYICIHHLGTETINDECKYVASIHVKKSEEIGEYTTLENDCIALMDTAGYKKYMIFHNNYGKELYNELVPKKGDFNLFENGISTILRHDVGSLTIKGVLNENRELILIKLIPVVDEDSDNPFKDEYPVHDNCSFEKIVKNIENSVSSENKEMKVQTTDRKEAAITKARGVLVIIDFPDPNSGYASIDDAKFMNFVINTTTRIFCCGKIPFNIDRRTPDLISRLVPLNDNEIKELKDTYGLDYEPV